MNSVHDILKSGEDECTVTPECTVINAVMYDKYYNKLKESATAGLGKMRIMYCWWTTKEFWVDCRCIGER